jgi:hypothetical protein
MISRLPEKSVPDWLAKISQSTIKIDPFPLTQLLEDSLYYPSSGFDGDPVKYLSGNILSYIYVDYGHSQDKLENEILKRGFRGYDLVATRSVTEQELTPRGWRPIQPTQYHVERSSYDWFDHNDLTIEGFKIFYRKNREAWEFEKESLELLSEQFAVDQCYFDNLTLHLEEEKSELQDMNGLQRESALQDINDRQRDIETELEYKRRYYRTECENFEELSHKFTLMGDLFWGEKEPYCSWSIFQRGEDVPSIHGPPRFSLLYLCADGVAAFQALYYANSASPKAVAVIQPGTAFGGNWTDFDDPSGIFARTVFGNPKGSPQILLNGGRGNRDFFREPCWPSYTELICFLDKSRGGSIGVWVEKDKPGSTPESNSND